VSDKSDLPPLREVIRSFKLSANKALSQNFILDLNITRRIAREAGPLDGKTIIEVGPGPGGLTRALLEISDCKVVAIERDQRCLPALDMIRLHYPDRLRIVIDDALEVDYTEFATGGATEIVANLPYGLATMLLIRWLKSPKWPPWYQKMTLMFQKEVAERIVATPGSKSYGRLSILTSWCSDARILYTLPARVFTPAPKVDSALVEIVPKTRDRPQNVLESLERVTAAAFGQRRKMLRQSLKQITQNPVELLELAGIAPDTRPEHVQTDKFIRLACLMAGKGDKS